MMTLRQFVAIGSIQPQLSRVLTLLAPSRGGPRGAPGGEALGAELASGAGAAAIAPVMAGAAFAAIAAVGLLDR